MIFSSINFAVFLAVTLALYAACDSQRQRAGLLLVASIIFYASWKPTYLILLGASLGLNYLFHRHLVHRQSRPVLVMGVAINLLTLGFAKYLGLFLGSVLGLAGALGLDAPRTVPVWVNWALPLGISFYTFHMLSALFDAYSGVWRKRVSFARWCLYVTFFPHLIAGPILRPGQLIDQLGTLAPLSWRSARLGAAIFFGGLIKKVIFADNLGPIADAAFANPGSLDVLAAWAGTLAFTFQIYFDFSGYSEMAIGLALLFGVQLPRNFVYPYISRNPTDFWKRWHITLSAWLRDYLYIALGGNRRGAARTHLNLMLTMLLGGLWHGANWTFVAWGGLHGLYLVGHRLLENACRHLDESHPGIARIRSHAGIPVMFLLTVVSWVFFRAKSFTEAWSMLRALAGTHIVAAEAVDFRLYELAIVGVSALVVWTEPCVIRWFERHGIGWWWHVPYPIRGIAYASLVLLIIAFGGSTQEFIYFDF